MSSTQTQPPVEQLLNIPSSPNTVRVSIIDTTSTIRCPADIFLSPSIGNLDRLTCNAFAFLIENPRSGMKVVFDLGVRKDWENLAKPMVESHKKKFEIDVKKGVSELLQDGGIQLEEITSIIWSHWHFDHIGDPSTFPTTTSLIVGPGTSAAKLPPWPENPASTITESDIRGRKLIEINQAQFSTKIGDFNAYDLFGDQSFYLLDVPGHAIGHMCGLARTTEDSFILMGADTCHHAGEYRPSQYVQMPDNIVLKLPNSASEQVCPCGIFENIHPHPDVFRTEKFYDIRVNEDGTTVAHDPDKAKESIRKLQKFDAADNVFVICAHDTTLVGIVDVFPKEANNWRHADWKMKARWKFLGDWDVVQKYISQQAAH